MRRATNILPMDVNREGCNALRKIILAHLDAACNSSVADGYENSKNPRAVVVIELHDHLVPPLRLAAGQVPATATKACIRGNIRNNRVNHFQGSDVKPDPAVRLKPVPDKRADRCEGLRCQA